MNWKCLFRRSNIDSNRNSRSFHGNVCQETEGNGHTRVSWSNERIGRDHYLPAVWTPPQQVMVMNPTILWTCRMDSTLHPLLNAIFDDPVRLCTMLSCGQFDISTVSLPYHAASRIARYRSSKSVGRSISSRRARSRARGPSRWTIGTSPRTATAAFSFRENQ